MRFRKAVLAVGIGSAALSALAATTPDLGPGLFGMGGEGRGSHHQRGHGDGYHGDHHHHGARAMSPERAQARIERMTERLIKWVEGTPEQKEKINLIAKAAAKDLQELRKQSGDLRRQGLALLHGPTVDRGAIEALRGQQMAMADALSRRMSVALADTAEVLTPEQRTRLGERMQSRSGRRG